MIRLDRVTFRYEGGSHGVVDIDLHVPQGACVVLCGASGCGKTTLTRLMNGLAPRFYRGRLEGSVTVEGEKVPDAPSWETSAHVGSVFQDPKSQFFSSELPGEVAFACENLGMDQNEVRRRTDAAIADLELDYVRDRPLDALSNGEKQRVAIASVCAPAPKTLVFDEPTANLDTEGARQLARIVKRFKNEGFTQVVAEHRLAWLDGVADRCVYLESGRIRAEFTPDEMRSMDEGGRRQRGSPSPAPCFRIATCLSSTSRRAGSTARTWKSSRMSLPRRHARAEASWSSRMTASSWPHVATADIASTTSDAADTRRHPPLIRQGSVLSFSSILPFRSLRCDF